MSKLENALADILQKAASGIDEAVGFLSSEIPDVAQQVLAYSLVESLTFGFIYAAFTAVLCILKVKLFKYDFWEGLVLLTIGSVSTFFLFVTYIMDAVKIWIAPKLYLLEYAADIVK